MGNKRITDEEIKKAKTLISFGLSNQQIAEIIGRPKSTISLIRKDGLEKDREKSRLYRAKQRAEAAEQCKYQQIDLIEEPTEEAELKAPMDEELRECLTKYERLLQHIAESIDYNNALMNGVCNKMQMILDELGVKS